MIGLTHLPSKEKEQKSHPSPRLSHPVTQSPLPGKACKVFTSRANLQLYGGVRVRGICKWPGTLKEWFLKSGGNRLVEQCSTSLSHSMKYSLVYRDSSILDDYNPMYIYIYIFTMGSIIHYNHHPTEVLNTAQL